MYISLARKYRPRTFADVAVQSHVSSTLRGAIARGRVAHGYLLCGPRGVGKTTLARVLAMALNCERRGADGEPCGTCASCERIWSGAASLDVVEIDAASNRGVDDARELRERAMYAPSTDTHYKVYIVDEAHMLTREAWNALLKILEEPPPRVVFVFATTEPQKIAQTAAPVLSRLQRFDFKRIGPADVRARLATVLAAEGVAAEPDALAMLARAADGSMRDALSLTDQALSLGDGALTAQRVRDALGLVPEDAYLEMLDLMAGGDAAGIFPAVARLVDAGVDLQLFLAGLADMLRAELAVVVGGRVPDLSEHAQQALAARAGRLDRGDLLRMLAAITELEPRFRRSGQQQILLETLLVRFALMDRTVLLEEVLRSLGVGDGGAHGGHEKGEGEGEGEGDADSGARRAAPPPRPRPGTSRTARADAPPRAAAVPRAPVDHARQEPPGAAMSAGPASAERQVPLGASTTIPLTREPAARRAVATLPTLAARWADVAEALRADGRAVLAVALEHAHPAAVSDHGDVTLELDPVAAPFEQPLTEGAEATLAAITRVVGAAARLHVRVREGEGDAPEAAPPRRLTEEGIRVERLALLRRKDPALDIAVETLDLELLD